MRMTFKQRFHRLRFFVSDAWDEWRHSPGVNLLAVATLASTLFVAGLLVLVVSNVQSRVQRLRDDVRVVVYLEDGASPGVTQSLKRSLAVMDGVSRVEFVGKGRALERYREWAADSADLIEELDSNPLPASLDAYLLPGPEAESQGEAILAAVEQREGVEDVRFNRLWLQRLEALLDVARIGGGGLAVLVFVAVVFVMSSVLRLAVYARRDEIDIMLLVGATPAFVRGPFLVAGVAQGLISSAVALALVELARRGALAYGESRSLALLDLVTARPIPWSLAGMLILVGLVVSFAGSFFAVRRSFTSS